jgi:uncharacterized protein YndB with AHSA1/START domain
VYCEVRITRRYAAGPAEVWAALTEPASLGRWLGRPGKIELSPGGAFELDVGPSDLEARVREVDPGRVLELDWRYGSEDPSVLRFELAAEGKGTVLILDHRQIEEPVGRAYMSRWTASIERLGALLR